MDDSLRRELAGIVGNAGVASDSGVHPSNVSQLREVLAASAAAGARVAPGGSEHAEAADVVIVAGRLDAIRLDATTLLLHAGAAARWTAVREAAGARRLTVAALPPLRNETVGPSVADGEIAHRTLAGVDILTAAGELISAGGRTLKDVVGYDLPGLALGSGGRLGLIVSVTLRLEPIGARTAVETGAGPWRGDGGIDLVAAFAG